jgi:hypothetical protein
MAVAIGDFELREAGLYPSSELLEGKKVRLKAMDTPYEVSADVLWTGDIALDQNPEAMRVFMAYGTGPTSTWKVDLVMECSQEPAPAAN